MRRRRTGRAAAGAVLTLLAAACTSAEPPARSELPAVESTTTVPVTLDEVLIGDNGALAGVPGRLLVLDEAGGIVTIDPDGTDRVVVAPADAGIARRSQPTWSPDGGRVAWTEATLDEEAFLVVADPGSGAVLSRDPAPFTAGYLAWGPAGRRLAFSGNDEEGRLRLAVGDPGSPAQIIDRGAPLYFDWDPSGDRLLVHIDDRFEYVSLDGEARAPIPVDGEFRLGAHAGTDLVYSTAREVGEVLVLGGSDGEVRIELLRYGAPTAYVVDPAADRLAVMSIPSAATQALGFVEGSDLPILPPNNLVVVDVATGDISAVAETRAVAWFWSPSGDQLLYSTIASDVGTVQLRWHTWDGRGSTDYAPFTPTGIFGRDYLAFFDQFARSLSLWAPDGSAFVYAGGSSLDDAGIWVQPVGGGDPVRVSLGVVAVWSPIP